MWKIFNAPPSESKSYLVRWKKEDGEFSEPHRAYYILDYDKFFSSETDSDFPIHVDVYMEIPEVMK